MSISGTFPLPGGKLSDGRTVIASVWGNDLEEYGPIFATVICLNPEAPYFTVTQVEPEDDGTWRPTAEQATEYNIVYAVEQYEQAGGDV